MNALNCSHVYFQLLRETLSPNTSKLGKQFGHTLRRVTLVGWSLLCHHCIAGIRGCTLCSNLNAFWKGQISCRDFISFEQTNAIFNYFLLYLFRLSFYYFTKIAKISKFTVEQKCSALVACM
jgi:hypothetical protein